MEIIKMKDDQFKAWETKRNKGKLRFLFIHGILSFGLPMFFIMAFISKPFTEGFSSETAIAHFITWLLAGLIFGVIMWHLAEYNYKVKTVRLSNT
jgi:hypothetical protein